METKKLVESFLSNMTKELIGEMASNHLALVLVFDFIEGKPVLIKWPETLDKWESESNALSNEPKVLAPNEIRTLEIAFDKWEGIYSSSSGELKNLALQELEYLEKIFDEIA